jgi:type III pantothenate kinase
MTTQTTIAIDAGNTRLKWGVHDGARWVERGALPTGEAARLRDCAAGWPAGAPVVACCVAGKLVEDEIANVLAGRFPPVRWLRSSAEACGVRNHYEAPERLGADRWAAMLGARGKGLGASLVVCAGTATTVDWLAADGEFRGGLILPGVDLMRTSLARNTAQLPLADGHFSIAPRNTADAIFTGCLQAQVGAVERMYAALRAESDPLCLLTGGAAPCIAPHLSIPFQLVDNLILDGLLSFGASL